jgi:hypothetical protein
MKKCFTPIWVLLLVMLCTINSKVFAQNFRTACPYNAASWPFPNSDDWMGCPPATFTNPNGSLCPRGYKTKPHQDCCGALIPCSTTVVIASLNDTINNRFNTAICGQGCSQYDLPPVGTTCFGVNERSTIWISIEIAPLPGQPYVIGAPAGKLRFKIVPCDIGSGNVGCGQTTNSPICKCDSVDLRSPTLCNDVGTSNIGATDVDWILFRTTRFSSRRSTCNSIASNNSTVVCCSWSGLSGPTGMFEAASGGTPSCDMGSLGGRYGSPIGAFVGDKFMLAVDNYSGGSLVGMKIDFGGICANETLNGPTARLKIDTSQIVNFISVEPEISGGRTTAINFDLNTDLNVNSFTLNEIGLLKEVSAGNFISLTDTINALIPVESPITSSSFRLITDTLLVGRYALLLNKTTPSDCGYDRISRDTAFFIVSNNVIKFDTAGNSCFFNPIQLQVDSLLYRNVSWSTGEQTYSINALTPGSYIVNALENSLNSNSISDTVFLVQRSLRNCPISISLNTQLDGLVASLPAFRYQWLHEGILINRFTRSVQVSENGAYRVRAINGSDTGNWSGPFIIMSNQSTVKTGGLNVYPNPSKAIVNIQVPAGFQTIELSDKLGKVILTKAIQNTTTLNVQGYPKGVYSIRAKGIKEVLSTQLIVE